MPTSHLSCSIKKNDFKILVIFTHGPIRIIHTPIVVQRGLIEPFPRDFDMLQFFKTFLPSIETLDLLNKKRFILCVVALLEACDVTNNGRNLGFYQELESTVDKLYLASRR